MRTIDDVIDECVGIIERPDKYVLIKYTSESNKIYYCVFATWYGGYAYGEEWRLNSGIKSYEQVEDYVVFHGNSGSAYIVKEKAVGTTAWTDSVMQTYLTDKRMYNDIATGVVISFDQFVKEFNR